MLMRARPAATPSMGICLVQRWSRVRQPTHMLFLAWGGAGLRMAGSHLRKRDAIVLEWEIEGQKL